MEEDRAQVDLGIAADIEAAETPEPVARQPKKRFVGRRTAAEATSRSSPNNDSIEDSKAIQGKTISLSTPVMQCETDRVE